MIKISLNGYLNPEIMRIVKELDEKWDKIRSEMIKEINQLYWQDTDESELLTSFVNGFFNQYAPEKEYTDEEILDWRSK